MAPRVYPTLRELLRVHPDRILSLSRSARANFRRGQCIGLAGPLLVVCLNRVDADITSRETRHSSNNALPVSNGSANSVYERSASSLSDPLLVYLMELNRIDRELFDYLVCYMDRCRVVELIQYRRGLILDRLRAILQDESARSRYLHGVEVTNCLHCGCTPLSPVIPHLCGACSYLYLRDWWNRCRRPVQPDEDGECDHAQLMAELNIIRQGRQNLDLRHVSSSVREFPVFCAFSLFFAYRPAVQCCVSFDSRFFFLREWWCRPPQPPQEPADDVDEYEQLLDEIAAIRGEPNPRPAPGPVEPEGMPVEEQERLFDIYFPAVTALERWLIFVEGRTFARDALSRIMVEYAGAPPCPRDI
ncbi:hypothetical protein QAD02_012977 [Eretmocerus hayati]|uniref:Uncharacterized protein n=1 Tax=Eretmocerus hayati TaxID=131215 RepID=A0ACC2P5Z3_9HYME|nr:hypothetical protein QAD02_012977 [Eretmocerus hayati]